MGGRTKGSRRGNGAGQGGPAVGLGWGGPANGAGSTKPKAAKFEAGNRVSLGHRDSNAGRLANLARAEEMLDVLYERATDPDEHGMVRMNAARAFRAEVIGQPIARNVNVMVDDIAQLSDADLHAEIERMGGAETPPASRAPDTTH